MEAFSQDRREFATFLVRLAAFAATLLLTAAFFLPWVRLDGATEAHSGAELLAIVVSPTLTYLFAVSPVQAGVLIGCPAAVIAFAIHVVTKYAQRKTAPFATAAVLASSISVMYAATDLIAVTGPRIYFGLLLVVVLSGVLLIHQALIKLRMRLLRNRKLPTVHRALSIATGSGPYRWSER